MVLRRPPTSLETTQGEDYRFESCGGSPQGCKIGFMRNETFLWTLHLTEDFCPLQFFCCPALGILLLPMLFGRDKDMTFGYILTTF